MGYAVLCALLSLASLAFIALTALWMHRGQQRRAEIGIGIASLSAVLAVASVVRLFAS